MTPVWVNCRFDPHPVDGFGLHGPKTDVGWIDGSRSSVAERDRCMKSNEGSTFVYKLCKLYDDIAVRVASVARVPVSLMTTTSAPCNKLASSSSTMKMTWRLECELWHSETKTRQVVVGDSEIVLDS